MSKSKTLNFTKIYKEKILSGKKSSTVRLRTTLKRGEVVDIIVGGERIGKAKILNVKKLSLKDLTNKDAVRDGFKDKKSLLKALKRHYSNITEDSTVYFISFNILEGQRSIDQQS